MEFERVKLDIDGPVATLTLNHPEVMNAVSPEMLGGLAKAMDEVEDPKNGLRCLVMTGEGRGFCTGANLQGRGDNNPGRADAGSALETLYHPFLRRLRNLKMPFITSVNGPAAGVGMSFAMMGDLILCARSAYFLQAFRRIGLVPDGGSTWILPRLVGKARAMELSAARREAHRRNGTRMGPRQPRLRRRGAGRGNEKARPRPRERADAVARHDPPALLGEHRQYL